MMERQSLSPSAIHVRPGDFRLTYGEDLEVFRYDGKRFNGVMETENEGNWIQECEYRDGLSEGWCRMWNLEGQMIHESQDWRGWSHGVTRKWNCFGVMTAWWVDEFEIPVACKEWDENGVLVYDYRLKSREECPDELDLYKWDHIEVNRERYGGVAPQYFDRIDNIPIESGSL